MRYFQTTSLIAALMLLITCGCSQPSDDPALEVDGGSASGVTLVNTACPIQGHPANDAVTVDWNGKTVGFCCAECIPTWNDLSEEEKADKLASAGSEAPADPMHHHASEAASSDAS